MSCTSWVHEKAPRLPLIALASDPPEAWVVVPRTPSEPALGVPWPFVLVSTSPATTRPRSLLIVTSFLVQPDRIQVASGGSAAAGGAPAARARRARATGADLARSRLIFVSL